MNMFRKNLLALAIVLPTFSFAQQAQNSSYSNANNSQTNYNGFSSQSDANLGTITVSGQKKSEPNKTFLADSKKIEQSNATDLKDIFIDTVGVQLGGGNGLSQHLTIRGMGEDQVDYVVDGIASTDINNFFHHQGRNMLDPYMVKIVEVEKGTGAASAGFGATSGRIIAETKDAKDLLREGQNLGFSVRGGLSSNKGDQEAFSLYGKSDDNLIDAIVAANYVHDKEYKGGRGYVSSDGTDKVGGSALGNRSLYGKVNLNFNEDWTAGISHRREENYGERNLREEFYFGTANDNPQYKHRINDTTNLYLKGQNAGFIDKVDAQVFSMVSKSELQTATPKNTATGSNINLTSNIGEHHSVKYGLNYRKTTGKNDVDSAVKQEKNEVGAYVEGIWGLADDRVTLTTGLRYDHFDLKSNGESSDGHLSPSVGVIWDINDNLSLNASHNRATRAPRLYETQLTSSPVSYADDLKAEHSYNNELGLSYRQNGFTAEASVFQQKIKNLTLIEGGGRTGRPTTVSSNGGTLKNTGYEGSIGYQYEGLKAKAGVAYSKPKLDDGVALDTIATAIPMGRQWFNSLSYRFDNPNLELGWRGRYAEKAAQMVDTGLTSRGGGSDTERTGYGVHDFYLNWQPTGKDDFNVNLSIDNAFNKYYRSHSQRAGQTALPEPGRDVRLNFNYRF
ncbi:MAG: TonB-dependent receptor [Cardiobacteriaceae bacterium]|nr:TonB-dependent receptor [Cardiobacteriaceae bacterium]